MSVAHPTPDFSIVHAEEDADFDAIFSIREEVFENELGVPEEAQIDGFDHISHHYIIVSEGKAQGVSRWRITLGGNVRLERLAIRQPARQQGLGAALMNRMLADVPKSRAIHIECLESQEDYFGGFGFVREGEGFEFHGLPHVRMRYAPADKA